MGGVRGREHDDHVNGVAQLAVALPILAGIWALFVLSRPVAMNRGTRRSAVAVSAVLALPGWLAGTILFGLLSGMFGATPNWAAAAVAGLVVGALVFASGLFGYTVLARRGPGALPVLGAIVAPFVLMGAPLWLAGQLQASANRSYEEQQHAEEAARSAFLHVTATVVSVSADPSSGSSSMVRLAITVVSDRDFPLLLDPYASNPYFAMMRRDPVSYAGTEAPAGSPSRLEAGREVRYDITMSLGQAPSEVRGSWILTVGWVGGDGLRYNVRVPVEVPPPS
jgi:hypothetical protein